MAKTIWSFELNLPEDTDRNWMDQKAYLVFEPKPLFVEITERAAE